MKIRCTTLFDITKTDINTRRELVAADAAAQHLLNRQRNQQSNFETVLQVINMRAQPEDITDPVQSTTQLSKNSQFGINYSKHRKPVPTWSFEFSVNHDSVFANETGKLGTLVQDCNAVPIITGLDEWPGLNNQLNTTLEHSNIYFEVIDETTQH